MPPATTGTYRVLQVSDDRCLLADREDEYEPVAVTPDPDLDADLDPGNVIEADIAFGTDEARLLSATVTRPTVFEFVPDASVVFEAARDEWNRAQAAGEGMGSRVTRDTDGAVNGVLYVFADTPALVLAQLARGEIQGLRVRGRLVVATRPLLEGLGLA